MQPTHHHSTRIDVTDAFNGGGSLRLTSCSVALFRCELDIKRCFYAITYKSEQKVTSRFEYIDDKKKTLDLFGEDQQNNEFIIEYIE